MDWRKQHPEIKNDSDLKKFAQERRLEERPAAVRRAICRVGRVRSTTRTASTAPAGTAGGRTWASTITSIPTARIR